ncbi:hypothetical protein [Vibrio parahaemolyticus]|uniref:hypothetical protein n=1 Tax=Vibrio parahaemolyticus TaxID=670 RepID=UPI00111047A1|nr:hypothetical protein [Vibrio parahaemolyticus]TMX39562.1 hypothetical protein DA098_09750 [Vibrio parahaemolyticus]TMX80371.1 hypothetical protein DA094_02225 [Vibrio parahaemolyticus]
MAAIKHPAGKLCSDSHTQQKVARLRDVIINQKKKSGFPVFEEYAYLAKRMPFYAYDHPEFLKICDTAFTDGRAIYFAKDFIEACFSHDVEMKGKGIKSHSALFLALHELKHNFEQDFVRLVNGKIPADILNIGQDIHNNLQLYFNFKIPLHDSSPLFNGYGLTKEELEKYGGLTSDSICLDLYREAVNQLKEQLQQQNQSGQQQQSSSQQSSKSGQQQQNSSQQSSQSGQQQQNSSQQSSKSGQQQQSSSQQQNQTGNQQQSSPSQQTNDDGTQNPDVQDKPTTVAGELAKQGIDGYSDLADKLRNKGQTEQHVVDPQKVKDAADAAELSDMAKDRLGLRSELDLKQIEAESKATIQQAVMEADKAHSQLSDAEKKETSIGTGKGTYSQKLNLDGDTQMSWETYAREVAYLGGGNKFAYTEDVINDAFFSDPTQYEGIIVPEKRKEGIGICIMDTSGSMNRSFMARGFNETLEAIESGGVEEFLVFPADVDISEYWICDRGNINQVRDQVLALGGGGTDYTIPLKNAHQVAAELDKEVLFTVFFTDLDGHVPAFEYIMTELEVDELPPTIFVTDCSDKARIQTYDKALGEYGVCFEYAKGLEVNLQEIEQELEEVSETGYKLGIY